jgi:GT2 family glycosyltransferase
MGSPLVSTVVVAYNNWPDVELAIQSALCQSYKPTEVIVVDNSSEDVTPVEVPKRFVGRIMYVRQPNSGDAGAYNTGLIHARGEFVQFLDGDDILTPYKVEKQMEVFREDPGADIVFGDQRVFQSFAGQLILEDYDRHDYDDMIAAHLPPIMGGVDSQLSALFRRRALDRIGPWDTTVYVTDLDYFLRAASLGCRFRHCKSIAGFARIHPRQMSWNWVAVRRGREAVLLKALSYIHDEPNRTLVRRWLEQIQFSMATVHTGMTRSEAMAKWHEARKLQSGAVAALAYWLAACTILFPRGLPIVRSRILQPFRSRLARLLGVRD